MRLSDKLKELAKTTNGEKVDIKKDEPVKSPLVKP